MRTAPTNGLLVQGNVGIGTYNPMSELQVNGGEVQIGSSGASCTANNAGAIRYSGGTLYYCNSSVWTASSAGGASGTVNIGSQYQMAYYSATGNAVSGDSSITTDSGNDLIIGLGKLGIGTTSPVASLDLRAETDAIALPVGTTGQEPVSPVNGMIRYNSSVGVQDLEAYVNGAWTTLTTGSNVGGSTIDLGTSATVPNPVSQYSNYTGLFSPSASAVGITISSTEMMRVNATGVGIGTTSPANKLDVQGGALSVNNGYPSIIELGGNTTAFDVLEATSGTLLTINKGAYFNVDIIGNVGIGTTSPQYAFDVEGGRSTFGSNSATYALGVKYSNTNNPNGTFWLGASNSATPDLIFSNNPGTEVMRITNGGSVGIGTTNPMSELQINGGEVQIGSSGASCTANNAGAIRYSGGTLYYCNASVWTASSAGGASGSVNIGSQYQMAYYSATGNAVSGDSSITTDSSNDLIINGGNLAVGTSNVTNAITLDGQASRTVGMIRDMTAGTAGNNLTLIAGGATSGSADKTGGNLILSSGISTGTNTSNIQMQVYPAAASTSSSDNTATIAMTISETGTVTGGTGSFGDLATTVQSTAGSGTDKNGATLNVASGVSTGTGSSGINFNIYKAGSTGTTANAATTAMTITNAGNVGIGTTNPNRGKLQINQLSTYNSETSAGLTLFTGTLAQPELVFGVDNGNTLSYIQSASSGTSYTTVPLVLQPNGGNVGIGTTNPINELDVQGGALSVNSGAVLGSYPSIIELGGNTTAFDVLEATSGTLLTINKGAFFNVDIVGNVGIGTTNPMSDLQVYGGEVQIGSSGAACNANTAGAIRYSGGTLYYCNASVWTASSAGGASGTVNIGSQYQMAYYAANGNAVSGDSNVTTDSSNDFIISGGNLAVGTSNVTNAITLDGQAARTVGMIRDMTTGTAGNNLTIQAGGAVVGGTDKTGGNLILSSGISTGTNSSNVQVQVYPAAAGTSGVDNTATTALTISETGSASGGTGSFGNMATTLQSTANSGTDRNGATLNFASGVSTGTGSSGINFNVYGAGSTSSSANNPTTAMTIASTGNVGIGSTFPNYTLDVNTGTVGAAVFHVIPQTVSLTGSGSTATVTLGTSAATPDPYSSFSSTTGLFSDSGSTVEVTISGSEKLRVNATGLGIGTTLINNALDVNGAANIGYKTTVAPSNGLIVSGNAGIGTSNPGALFTVGNNAFEVNSSGVVIAGTWNGSTVGVTYGGTGTATQFTQGSIVFAGASGIYTQDNSQFFWNDTAHSLGIGTANPMSELQVNGGEVQIGSSGASCTANNAGAIRYSGGTLYYCNSSAWTAFGAAGAGGSVNIGSQYQMAYYSATGTAVSGDSSITTDSSNDLIVGLGKLGIGTTTPVASLDLRAETDAIALPVGTTGQEPASPVNGMIRYNSSVGVQDVEAYINGAWTTLTTGGSTASITLGTSAAKPDPYSSFSTTTGLFSAASGQVSITSTGSEIARFSGTGLAIGTTYVSTAAPTNGMIVQGNVGIGTTNPMSELQVYGGEVQIGSSGASCTANNAGAIRYASGTAYYCNSTAWTAFGAAGSSGTVNIGSQYQMAYYNATGTAVTGDASVVTDASNNLQVISGNLAVGTSNVSNAITLNGQAARTVGMIRDMTTGTAGNNLTIQAGGAFSGGTDLIGGNLILSSGISTGTNTSNVQLQVYPAATGSSGVDNTATTALTISETGSASGGAGSFGNQAVTAQATANAGTDKNGATLNIASGISTGTGSSGINFNIYKAGSTSSSANSPTTAMTIASNGNVGIGAGPAYLLDVNGASVVSRFNSTNNSNVIAISEAGTIGGYIGALGSSLSLYGQAATAGIVVTSGGSVGIGTTNPMSELQVYGGEVQIGSSGAACNANTAGAIRYSGTTLLTIVMRARGRQPAQAAVAAPLI